MELKMLIQKLNRFYRKHKRLPSYQEMADLFGYASKGAVQYVVNKLIEEKIIAKDASGKLIPLKLGLPVPFLGSIRAGLPNVQSDIFEALSFDDYLIEEPEESYLLKVKGDSMIEAGIFDGDVVIIEKNNTPQNGDIIAAEIDGEFTLKYFKKDKNQITLIAANPKYKALIPQNDLKIHGKVVGIARKYQRKKSR
jgi:repressor LexA